MIEDITPDKVPMPPRGIALFYGVTRDDILKIASNIDSFVWSQSLEGRAYWREVQKNLEDVAALAWEEWRED